MMVRSHNRPADKNHDALLEAIEEWVTLSYGHQLSSAQRRELKQSLVAQQAAIKRLRAFPLANGDEPALVYKVPAP